VGDGPAPYAEKLRQQARSLGLDGRLVWAGTRRDMPAVYSACDLVTLCSRGESLPNALGEAMACEIPVVATAVGDTPRLLGATGTLVPPANPAALAAAWRSVLTLRADASRSLGSRARARIVSEFRIERTVELTSGILCEIAGNGAGPSRAH
jgi:glycosyltransferase involved in cell wall biosynthesis